MRGGLGDYFRHLDKSRRDPLPEQVWPWCETKRLRTPNIKPIVPRREGIWQHKPEPPYFWLGRDAVEA